MIVIVSHPQDAHATSVGDLLRTGGHTVLLLDISDFPSRAKLAVEYRDGRVARLEYRHDQAGAFDLARAHSVWWRRPQAPDLRSVTDTDAFTFAHNEWQEAINGLWQLIGAPWMNPPANDEVASRKALQLKIASQIGLRIPRTLITSDPDAARSFIADNGPGRTIFKTFSCTHTVWRETRLVGQDEVDKLDLLRLAPVIFQEYVESATDLRVTVVGRKIFAAAIDSRDTDYPVDFRMSLGQARTEATDLPQPVADKLLALMDRLGLVYGAIDMRRTSAGEHVFLEINTAGEFLFVAERTGLPIARAVADWLATPG